ncbi:MAG: hypothetical protein ACE5FA_13860 [Dehalococcoidia bacterium]
MRTEPGQRLEEVSVGGDSGSWWLDRATMRAIDMLAVLDALNVDLVTEAQRVGVAPARRVV